MDRFLFLVPVLKGLTVMPDGSQSVAIGGLPVATVAGLRAWVRAEAATLAAAFDRRNLTAAFSLRVQAADSVRPAPEPLDFTVIDRAALSAPADDRMPSPVHGPAASIPDDTPTQAAGELARGDHLAARKEWPAAIEAYLSAARLAEGAGQLDLAGLGYAEAAHGADLLGDDDGAQQAYSAAVARLVASGTGDSLLAQVLVAWAPVAARLGDPETALPTAEAALERLLAVTDSAEDPSLLERDQRERLNRRADLHDAIARLIASHPAVGEPGREVADAIGHAAAAAEDYAGAGDVAGAAHSFWLAGRLERDRGDLAAAEWHLESAMEGFGLAGDGTGRTAACGELIALLRSVGQDARADALAASLGDAPGRDT